MNEEKVFIEDENEQPKKRVCSHCRKEMEHGFYISGMVSKSRKDEYYCTEKHLYKHYDESEWRILAQDEDEEGEPIANDLAYWTVFD